jgi:predicted nucleic acid-binding protein
LTVVVDASVTIAWIVEDEQSAYADTALTAFETDHAIVPAIWHWEISNTLLVLERKGRLTDAILAYSQIVRFPIDVEQLAYTQNRRASLELELARKHQLSVYDAAYLALAKATSHRLATIDLRLAEAARKEGLFYDP